LERGNDEKGCRSVARGLPDETNELQSVDVGHVDVGDDEIERPARQDTHGVEPGACLDDLASPVASAEFFRLEHGANESAGRDGILHDEDCAHETPRGYYGSRLVPNS